MKHRLEIGLPEAAQLLRLPYQSAHRLVLVGALAGEKRAGRWFVRRADVIRLSQGRSQQVVSAEAS